MEGVKLRKFKACKLHHLSGEVYNLKDMDTVDVHNPKLIMRKEGGVVSETERKVIFKEHRIIDNFGSLKYGFD